jgi:hypothetical protein
MTRHLEKPFPVSVCLLNGSGGVSRLVSRLFMTLDGYEGAFPEHPNRLQK